MTAGTIRSYNVSDLSHKGHHSDRLAGHLTHFRLRTYSEGSTVDIWLFKRQTPLSRIYVTAYLRNIQPLGGIYFSYMFTVGDVLNTLKCLPIVFNAYHYKPINFLFTYACSTCSIFGRRAECGIERVERCREPAWAGSEEAEYIVGGSFVISAF